MLFKTTLSLAAAVGIAAILPATASAAQTAFNTTPVSLSACSSETTLTPTTPYLFPRASSDLHYRFVNNAVVAARSVTFDIVSDGQVTPIVETGSFAPGVAIDRTIAQSATAFEANSVSCRVQKVDFQDGTSWHADSAKMTASR